MILLAMPFLSMLGGCSQRSATVVPEGIQARRFELVAANSTMLARLAPSREGAALVFMYPNQKTSLSLIGGNIKDRPAIMLYDRAGKTKLMVNTNPEGPAIAFFDEKDNPRIGMLVGAKRPEMHILSADNNRIFGQHFRRFLNQQRNAEARRLSAGLRRCFGSMNHGQQYLLRSRWLHRIWRR